LHKYYGIDTKRLLGSVEIIRLQKSNKKNAEKRNKKEEIDI